MTGIALRRMVKSGFAALALVLTSALGVVFGAAISRLLSPRMLSWIAGVGFIGVGVWSQAGSIRNVTTTARRVRRGLPASRRPRRTEPRGPGVEGRWPERTHVDGRPGRSLRPRLPVPWQSRRPQPSDDGGRPGRSLRPRLPASWWSRRPAASTAGTDLPGRAPASQSIGGRDGAAYQRDNP